MTTGNDSMNSSHFPYQACLMTNLPEESQHKVRYISNYIVVPLDMVMAVLSFICNALVFITVTRTNSLRHPSLLILCSLSISDLIWALYTLIKDILILLDPHMCPGHGFEQTCIVILCFLATLSNLATVSRDRYLAMSRPGWYRSHVGRSRVVKATLLNWLSSTLTALVAYTLFKLTLYDNEKFIFIIIFLFYVVCILMILFNYVRLLIANKRHCRNMRKQVGSMRTVAEKESKLTRVISVILLCFMFSFLPAVLSPVILLALRVWPITPFRPFYSMLLTLNGLLNPLLNYGRNKEIRRAMRNMLSCCRHGRISQQLPAVKYNKNNRQENNIQVESGGRRLQELHIAPIN